MLTKEQFLKAILENDSMRTALSKVKDKKEERTARAAVNELVGQFYDSLTGVVSQVQKDPEKFKKAVTEWDSGLINNEGDSNVTVTKDK